MIYDRISTWNLKWSRTILLLQYEKKSMDLQNQIEAAAAFLKTRGIDSPDIGVILGTGLGGMVARIEIEIEIEYKEIPFFPLSTVESHKGRLIYGRVGGRKVLAMQGRFHYYEGYSLQQITFPVRVMKALGINTLLLSNASGVMNPEMKKGSLMLMEDHINLIPGSPLSGHNLEKFGPRFPDMSCPYSQRLGALVKRIAREKSIDLYKGVYVAVAGPQFETRAEYRFLRALGADVVGMSTVPEVIVGVHMGMEILAISVMTDSCDPDNLEPASLEEILATAAKAEVGLTELFLALIRNLT